MRDNRAGGFEDALGRTVVLFQPDGDRAGKIALEIQDVSDVGAAPAVDRLRLVAHHHQIVLAAIGVLIFVHHHELVLAIETFPRGGIVPEQAHGFEQQIVEVERVRFVQAGFVEIVDLGEAFGDRIGRGHGHVLGVLIMALRVADARERGPMLHELIVQAKLLVDALENRQLIVVVVDGEARGKAPANRRERRAVAAQHTDAEPGERRDGGGGLGNGLGQRTDPVTHLSGSLVREGDGQNSPSGDPVGAQQVRHPVRDDARLPAARSGQDKKRPFDMLNRLALTRVQPF